MNQVIQSDISKAAWGASYVSRHVIGSENCADYVLTLPFLNCLWDVLKGLKVGRKVQRPASPELYTAMLGQALPGKSQVLV